MSYDVFISYRHGRKAEVIAFCQLLEKAGLTVFRDEERRNDHDLIQRGIEEGLGSSKLVLAWFDPSYLESRACTWELGRALMAARRQSASFEDPLARIVCINPTESFSHIPEELWNRARVLDGGQPGICVAHVIGQLSKVSGTLGMVPAELTENWYERECPRHPTWVGRESEIIRIYAQLCRGEVAMKGDERAPVAITGHGGEGKTMLVEEYAIRHASGYSGGVVWLSGSPGSDGDATDEWLRRLESELQHIASGPKLGISEELIRQALTGITDARRRVRVLKRMIEDRLAVGTTKSTNPSRRPYLWVVDDLPRLANEDMLLWIPNSSHIHCLVTMRGVAVGATFREIELGLLAQSQALQILTRRLPPAGEAEETAAREIVELLGRLPLALELAGAAVDTYQALLELLLLPMDVGLEPLFYELKSVLPTQHASSILKTVDRSLELFEGADEVATGSKSEAVWTLLRTSALLSPAPLPDVLALRIHKEMGFPVAWFQIALTRVKAGALLQRPGPAARPCSLMHALLARTVVETRVTSTQRAALFDAIVRAIKIWLEEEKAKPPIGVDDRIFSAAAPLLLIDDSLTSASMSHALGEFAYGIGRWHQALRLHEHSMDIRVRVLAKNDTLVVDSVEGIALALMSQGNVRSAKSQLEDVVSHRLANNGSTDPLTLRALSSLAVALYMLDDFEAARERQEWVLLCKHRVDAPAVEVLGCASSLALTLEAMGDHLRAGEMHLETWKSRRLLLGEDDPDTLDSLQHLALINLRRGNLRSAQASFRAIGAAHDRRAGPNSPSALSAKHNLALTWHQRGKLRAACILLRQLVERLQETLGPGHPMTLSAAHARAEVLLARGESGPAAELLKPLVDIRRQDLGDEDANTQNSMAALARAYFTDGRLDRARALQEFLLQSQLKKAARDDVPQLRQTLKQLEATVRAQEDFNRIRELEVLLAWADAPVK